MIRELITLATIFSCTTFAAPQQDLQKLDLSKPLDAECRTELDDIDKSFMRWQFPSELSWSASQTNMSSALTGVIVNRTRLQDLKTALPQKHQWEALTFTLAHEKSHLIQGKLLGNDLDDYPVIVREAQADIMAASYVYLKILRLDVSIAPDGRMVFRSLAPETNQTDWEAERKGEIFDLIRLGQRLGDSGPQAADHPEPWERSQAVVYGMVAGTAMMKLHLGVVDEAHFRSDIGMSPTEDFADWSLRKAYDAVGVANGTKGTVPADRYKLANSQDPFTTILRTCVEAASNRFRDIYGPAVRSDDDSQMYQSKVFLPEFNYADIQIDKAKDPLDIVTFRLSNAVPDDIQLGVYDGIRQRLSHLLRTGWRQGAERSSDTRRSQSWTNSDHITIYISFVPSHDDKPPTVIVKIEHFG